MNPGLTIFRNGSPLQLEPGVVRSDDVTGFNVLGEDFTIELHPKGRPAPDPDAGIVALLGTLQPGALVTEDGLAGMMGKHPASIRRAVERGELPRPARLMGKPTWTAGAIVRHFEKRLEVEEREGSRLKRHRGGQ